MIEFDKTYSRKTLNSILEASFSALAMLSLSILTCILTCTAQKKCYFRTPKFPAFAPSGKSKKPQSHCGAKVSSGDPAGIRTPDPLLKRQLLCLLSYRIIFKKRIRRKGRGWDGWIRTSG